MKSSALLTFLGTGTSQGVPVIACHCDVCRSADERDKRLRTSAMLEVNGKVILFDAGPDFRQQLLRENVQRLDGILITHEHKDHTAGLDDVRAFNYVMDAAVDIYGAPRVCQSIKSEFAYAFSDFKYPGAPEINLHSINGSLLNVAGVAVQPIQFMHLKLPVYGFRVGNFAYLTDVNYIPEESWGMLRGVEVMVVNALQKEKHISHFNLEEALEVISKLKPKAAYLTHASHRMGLYKEVQAELPPNVVLAYDGLKVDLSGVLELSITA